MAAAAAQATGLLAGALSGALSGSAGLSGGPRASFDEADEADTKYVRRQGAARRTLQALFPTLFQAGGGTGGGGGSSLPVSFRDAGGSSSNLPRVRSAMRPGRPGSSGGAPPASRRRRAVRAVLLLLAVASALGALVFFFARSHPDSQLPPGVRQFEREVVSAERAAVAAVGRVELAAADEYRKVTGAIIKGG